MASIWDFITLPLAFDLTLVFIVKVRFPFAPVIDALKSDPIFNSFLKVIVRLFNVNAQTHFLRVLLLAFIVEGRSR